MSTWTAIAIIVIVLVIFGGRGHRQRMERRRERGHLQGVDEVSSPAETIRERELQREVEELRERIQVLERIATDDRPAKRLSAEIESLRASDDDKQKEERQ